MDLRNRVRVLTQQAQQDLARPGEPTQQEAPVGGGTKSAGETRANSQNASPAGEKTPNFSFTSGAGDASAGGEEDIFPLYSSDPAAAILLAARVEELSNRPARSSSPTQGGEGGAAGQGNLGEHLLNLRMLEEGLGAGLADASAFDAHMGDHQRLLELAQMYEHQCHGLMALLTRVRDQTRAIDTEMTTRRTRLEARLGEIESLKERASSVCHEDQLSDLVTLIREWPRLSGDAQAQQQLDEIIGHIATVVSDVFGSSKYSPLVPAADGKGGKKGVSTGQEALLSLLEARVTDLCAQLDTIAPELRDSIFAGCEQARQARLAEERRQEQERRRAQRKQKHLERALAEPKPRPI